MISCNCDSTVNHSVQTELSLTQAGGSDFGLLGMGTVVKGGVGFIEHTRKLS